MAATGGIMQDIGNPYGAHPGTTHEKPSGSTSKTGVDDTVRSIESHGTGRSNVTLQDKVADPLASSVGEVHYKSMRWWQAGMLMIAETISLGILSLPWAMAQVGLIPGLILIIGLGLLATYTGYIVWQFKMAHPEVLSFADAGELIGGRLGREVLAVMSTACFVFVMAAHILAFAVMMNVLTEHATCTIAFSVTGLIISIFLSVPRTMGNVSWLAIASFLSITSAVLVIMIDLGILNDNKGNPVSLFGMDGPHQDKAFQLSLLAILNVMISYTGNVAFFGFISELRNPREFPKALILCQSLAIGYYAIVASVVYRYVGFDVPSPALSAAPPVVRKVAYGLASITILVAGVVNAHVAIKYVYIRAFRTRNPSIITSKSWQSRGYWLLILAIMWGLAWVLAEAIPVFNQLLGLLSAIFGSWFNFGLPAGFWLWLNKGRYTESKKKMALTALNWSMVFLAIALMVLGLYGTALDIKDAVAQGTLSSFSCANNAPQPRPNDLDLLKDGK